MLKRIRYYVVDKRTNSVFMISEVRSKHKTKQLAQKAIKRLPSDIAVNFQIEVWEESFRKIRGAKEE